MTTGTTWSGEWVARELGVRLTTTAATGALELTDLVGLAVRRNPRRAHLLVSTVLGKHVPADPRVVAGSGQLLGALVARRLGGPEVGRGVGDRLAAALRNQTVPAAVLTGLRLPAPVPATVVGFAETATGLGHTVAETLGAWFVHSTRRPVAGRPVTARFEEAHSHATGHLVQPVDAGPLHADTPVVLVDDELSTGRTAAGTVRALHALHPHRHYVLAGLVDLRGPGDRAALAALADELDTRIDVVALVSGAVDLAPDVLARGRELAASVPDVLEVPAGAGPAPRVDVVRVDWPAGLPEGGAHGLDAAASARVRHLAAAVAARVPVSGPTVVLGTEELMYLPLQVALALQAQGVPTRVGSTTRSPVVPVDRPDYAVRRALGFRAADTGDAAARFAYNLDRVDDVVVVTDDGADPSHLAAPDGLLTRLGAVAARVHLVTVPVDRRTGR